VLDETNVEMGIAHPLSFIASSGAGYAVGDARSMSDLPHPRSFGTFPRFFKKFVREKRLLSWETAVAKVTSMPADLFGISRRGRVKEKDFADLAVFNPNTISDNATFRNPFQYNHGMHAVVVNGEITFLNGDFTRSAPGKILFA